MNKIDIMAALDAKASTSEMCAFVANSMRKLDAKGINTMPFFQLFKDFSTAEEVVKYVDPYCA